MSVFLPEFIRARIMNILAVKQNFINEAIKKLNLKIVKKRKEKKGGGITIMFNAGF